MKLDDIEYELSLIHIHPHDRNISVTLEVTDIPDHEFAFFVIGEDDHGYMVSLNRNDPLEDETDYPEYAKKAIDGYFENQMSPDQMLDILQDYYNKCISGEYNFDNTYTDGPIDWIGLGKDNIKKFL